jgi:ribosomal protein S18 acetylase RimI-like enzyme
MPSHGDVPDRRLVQEVLDNVGGLTIVDDGNIVGYAVGRGTENAGYIDFLGVAEDARGRGLGRRLVGGSTAHAPCPAGCARQRATTSRPA